MAKKKTKKTTAKRRPSASKKNRGKKKTPRRRKNAIRQKAKGADFIVSYAARPEEHRPHAGELWKYRNWTVDVYRLGDDMYHWTVYAPLTEGGAAYWWKEPDTRFIVESIDGDEVTIYNEDDEDETYTIERFDLLGEPMNTGEDEDEPWRVSPPSMTKEGAKFDAMFNIDYILHTEKLDEKDPEKAEQVIALVELTREAMDRARSRGEDHLERSIIARKIEEMRGDSDYAIRSKHQIMSDLPAPDAVEYLKDLIERRRRIEDTGEEDFYDRFANKGGKKRRKKNKLVSKLT